MPHPTKFYTLQCFSCKKEIAEQGIMTNCPSCGGPIDAKYDYELIKKRLNTFALKKTEISALKYLDFYPIHDLEKVVTLQEGGTPLYHAENLGKIFGLKNLYIKNEGANPTGVFKDRGSLVELTKARELGAKAVCLASSGNMAASVSAYAAIAKIPCYVLVPEGTPIGKLVQIVSYGGRVIQVRTDYSNCAALAIEIAKQNGFYLAGDYVFRREGQKSTAYEIAEQLYWKAPDYLICPVGCATHISAIWKGFKEFYNLGLINKVPKIVAVQPAGCSPLIDAFEQKAKKSQKILASDINTVCSAVTITDVIDSAILLNGIYESKGFAVKISDEETLEYQQMLAREEAIFTEPSGALPIAALSRIIKRLKIKPDETVVCVATGNGLKDPITVLKYLPSPPTMDPDIADINRFLKSPFSSMKKTAIHTAKILWKKAPNKTRVGEIIAKEFDLALKGEMLDLVYRHVEAFDRRGKHVSETDLKGIIENILKEFSVKKPVVCVVDYNVQVQKKGRIQANVIFNFLDKTTESSADGVGPVDAITRALRKGIKNHPQDINCKLIDYEVRIKTKGTSSAVVVDIKVQDKFGNTAIGSATSPDIIEASVDAFVRGYNTLYWKTHSYKI